RRRPARDHDRDLRDRRRRRDRRGRLLRPDLPADHRPLVPARRRTALRPAAATITAGWIPSEAATLTSPSGPLTAVAAGTNAINAAKTKARGGRGERRLRRGEVGEAEW